MTGKFDEMGPLAAAWSRREIGWVVTVTVRVAHKYLLWSDLGHMVRIGMIARRVEHSAAIGAGRRFPFVPWHMCAWEGAWNGA